MRKILSALAMMLVCGAATAQVTPGSLVIGPATGGSQGTGTVNVSGGYYLNGFALSSVPQNVSLQYAVGQGSIAIASGGSGYAAGDTITLTCSGATFSVNPVITVAAVSSGVVIGSILTTPGVASVVGSACGTLTQSATSGSGTGATFTASFGPVAANYSVASLVTGGGATNGNFYLGAEQSLNGLYGAENTFIGDKAGGLVTGNSSANTAIGHNAMGINGAVAPTGATFNTFIGDDAGRNISGTGLTNNTCIGQNACRNIQSNSNTVIGAGAMGAGAAITGNSNMAVGAGAMGNATSATLNSAIGNGTLSACTQCSSNVAIGNSALSSIITLAGNVAIGNSAGNAQTGYNSVFVGLNAGSKANANFNTVIGANVATTTLVGGGGNVLIGTSATTDTVAAGTNYEINIANADIGYAIAPTITSGFGTSPTAPTQSSTFLFTLVTGTTPSTTQVVGMPTASNGWGCDITDLTTPTTVFQQTATGSSTTAVGSASYSRTAGTSLAPTAADVIQYKCLAR